MLGPTFLEDKHRLGRMKIVTKLMKTKDSPDLWLQLLEFDINKVQVRKLDVETTNLLLCICKAAITSIPFGDDMKNNSSYIKINVRYAQLLGYPLLFTKF